GRWLRRYREFGFQATGVDATPGMLGRAIECGTTAPLIAGEACYLPFADAKFDCVSDITVVQHIPRSLQPLALREMVRVLKPGGRLILMELIRGEDAHVFPRSPRDWIQQVASCGAKPIEWFGQEYFLLDRFFVRVAQKLAGSNAGHANADAQPLHPRSQHSSYARRIFWAIRHVTAPLSAWTDPLAEKICPAHVATHGVFVFGK
ncbi:MAG TPA: class I SAM-dependent methyltransferase, partial [Candidatus Acidoferrales bacterium]|nr:class I SAM-dependent methyltransferase [Candidatus Acidoferrales bacterium]